VLKLVTAEFQLVDGFYLPCASGCDVMSLTHFDPLPLTLIHVNDQIATVKKLDSLCRFRFRKNVASEVKRTDGSLQVTWLITVMESHVICDSLYAHRACCSKFAQVLPRKKE
jgi:hypothetical protein